MDEDVFMIFPVIRLDENYFLRRISVDNDAIEFFNFIRKKEVAAYLSEDDIPSSPETARIELGYWNQLFDRKACIYWAIATIKDNIIIGTCGFNYWNKGQRRAEISYDLNYDYWGRGIATKSVAAITNFALSSMKVQRVQATVAVDNTSSIKVLEKNGFKREGFMEKYGFLGGKARDFYMYSKCID